MGYLNWVKRKWDEYYKNQAEKQAQNTEKTNVETNNTENDIIEGCAGCGCLIVILLIVFSAVSWAFHIHWAFGVLLFLVLLGAL